MLCYPVLYFWFIIFVENVKYYKLKFCFCFNIFPLWNMLQSLFSSADGIKVRKTNIVRNFSSIFFSPNFLYFWSFYWWSGNEVDSIPFFAGRKINSLEMLSADRESWGCVGNRTFTTDSSCKHSCPAIIFARRTICLLKYIGVRNDASLLKLHCSYRKNFCLNDLRK